MARIVLLIWLAPDAGKRDQPMSQTYILEYEINDIPQAHIVTVRVNADQTSDQPEQTS